MTIRPLNSVSGAPRLIGSTSNEAIHGTLLHWLFRPSDALQRELEAEWMPRFLGQHVIGIQVPTIACPKSVSQPVLLNQQQVIRSFFVRKWLFTS